MKNLFAFFLVLALTFGCKGSAEPDATSSTPAPEAQAEQNDDALADTPDAETEAEDSTSGDSGANGAPEDVANDAGDDEDVEGSEATSDADAEPSKTSDIRLNNEITLKSAGEKPRRKLSYDFDKVKPMTVEARTDVDTHAQGHHIIIPRVVQRMTVTNLERVNDKVSITIQSSNPSYESRDSGDMHKMILESMREAPEVGRIRFSFEMDAHGSVSNAEIIDAGGSPEDAESVVTGQMRQFASVYPTEAVGKGATWQATSRIDMGGKLTLKTLVNYTLKELTDDGAVLEMRYEINDLAQSLNEITDDGNGQLIDGVMRGEGTLTIRFDQLLPTIDQHIVLDMTLNEGGEEVESSIKMRTQIVAVD